jgi:succinyl-diaminopimelate desuccinylase
MDAPAAPAGSAAAADSAAVALTLALLARPSVTPADAGCMELLAARLQASGFRAERFDRNGVSNLWLRRGRQRPVFVFAGHTDVVPTGPLQAWHSPPFEPQVRDGRLYARGAADMKASIAAFTVAAERFVAEHPEHPGSLALLLTSDEEGPAVDGTVAVVEALAARAESLDYCIVGEPTCEQRLGDTVKVGRRGSLSAHLTVRGVQGHVAYPQLARNPIHEFAPALEELAQTRWDDGTEDFPATSFQVSNLHAGTGAGNVIPGVCEVDFNLRFNPASSPESLRQRIERLLYSYELDFSIQWTVGARPFRCARGSLLGALQDAVREVTGVEARPSTTGGTSDGRFIAPVCPQVVEFGPSNGAIHQVDESLPLDEIDALALIYRGTLERVLLAQRSGD